MEEMNGDRSHFNPDRHVIYMENMRKCYDDLEVLADTDLAVSEGELLSLVGPSGCGKSTLLRLLLGMEKQTSGTLLIDGRAVRQPDISRGVVFQKYGLYNHLNILENVVAGLVESQPFGFRWQIPSHIADKGMAMLKRVGLEGKEKKWPVQLSGGQQQRVAIAQVLVQPPRILFMDEAFGALDQFTREDLQVFLLQLWEETKMTIFFVTHDLSEAVFLGSRVILLSQFYEDGKSQKKHGARIVLDIALPPKALNTEVKTTPEFISVVRQLVNGGMKPDHLHRVQDFNGSHPDSFITLK